MIKIDFELLFNKTLAWIFLIIGVYIHTIAALKNQIWYDEIFSIFVTRDTTISNIVLNSDASHPPLYYLLLHGFSNLDASVYYYRVFHLLIFILSLYLLWRVCQQLNFSTFSRNLLIFFFSISPYITELMYQIRMYGIAIFICVLSLFVLLKYFESPRTNLLLISTVISIIGFFTVYGYIFYIFAEFISCCLLYIHKRKEFIRNKLIAHFVLMALCSIYLLIQLYLKLPDIQNSLVWVHKTSISSYPNVILRLLGIFNVINPTEVGMSSYLYTVIPIICLFVLQIFLIFPLLKSRYRNAFSLSNFFLLVLIHALLSIFQSVYIINYFIPLAFFHYRQLFPVALAIYFGISFLVNFYSSFRKILFFPILIIFIFFYYSVYVDTLFKAKSENDKVITTEIIKYKDTIPLYIFNEDITTAYFICNANSFSTITTSCSIKEIYTTESLESLRKLNKPIMVIISNFYQNIGYKPSEQDSCSPLSPIQYLCYDLP